MTSFLVADRETKVCSAVSLLIEDHAGWELSGIVRDSVSLDEVARKTCPQVVILDWDLPDLRLADFLAGLERDCPDTRVIILSNSQDRDSLSNPGIRGFIAKNSSPERVVTQIEQFTGTECQKEQVHE